MAAFLRLCMCACVRWCGRCGFLRYAREVDEGGFCNVFGIWLLGIRPSKVRAVVMLAEGLLVQGEMFRALRGQPLYSGVRSRETVLRPFIRAGRIVPHHKEKRHEQDFDFLRRWNLERD